MSDDPIFKRWSKEDDFYSSGPVDPCAELRQRIADLERQLAELSYFTEPHAKGATGRWMTADEMIKEWGARFSELEEANEQLERHNELLRAVGRSLVEWNNANGCEGDMSNEMLMELSGRVSDSLQAAIDAGAVNPTWQESTSRLLDERRDLWQKMADEDGEALDTDEGE